MPDIVKDRLRVCLGHGGVDLHEAVVDVGRLARQLVEHGDDAADEDAAVPIVATFDQELLGRGPFGLFQKALDTIGR